MKNLNKLGLVGLVLTGLVAVTGCNFKRGERITKVWNTDAGKIVLVQEDIIGSDDYRLEIYSKEGKKVAEFERIGTNPFNKAKITQSDGTIYIYNRGDEDYLKR